MSRADHLKECDCFGVCYILPNQQIFVDLLFFHQWQNFFAGRSLETLGLANAVGCKFHLARQMCLFLVGVSCLRECTCNKRNRKKTNRQPSCLLVNTKKTTKPRRARNEYMWATRDAKSFGQRKFNFTRCNETVCTSLSQNPVGCNCPRLLKSRRLTCPGWLLHALSFQVWRPSGKSNSYVAKIMVVMLPPSF